MFFFPYRLDLQYQQRIKLPGVPFFTVLVCVVCILIFALQIFSERQYEKRVVNYCEHELSAEVIPVFKKIASEGLFTGCADFMIDWDINAEGKSLDYFAYKSQITTLEQEALVVELERFNAIVLNDPLTVDWWPDPLDSEITHYITASFLHAVLEYLLFNLVFFFAFSLVIEQLLGSVVYLLFFAFCCVATGISYEADLFGINSHLPTLGISGVVMGLMTLTVSIYPLERMAVFLWLLIIVTTITVPAILLVSFYVLSDVYGLAYLVEDNNVNYVVHLAGAISGIAFALLFYAYTYCFRGRNNSEESVCKGDA